VNSTLIAQVAAHAVDVVDISGEDWVATAVHIGECADGSRRVYALVYTSDGNLEQTFRVCSPAQWNSPDWATINYPGWTYEVQIGEGWMLLEDAATTREP